MQYSTELQKLMVHFNQSNEALLVWLCYGKLQSHLVPRASTLLHRLNTHLTTKCEIDNDVDGMPQWISGELFVGSGKKYEDLKEKQVLVFF